jgi:hypothetical protein
MVIVGVAYLLLCLLFGVCLGTMLADRADW